MSDPTAWEPAAQPSTAQLPPGPGDKAGFRQRVLSALKWNATGEAAFQITRFAFGIALARLLSPHEMGLMAMLLVIVQFLLGNSDLGFEEALVQRREVGEAHRSSVFWFLLGTALLLTVAQIVAAPWFAAFYGVEELAALAIALSAVFFLHVIGTVPSAVLTRRLDFRTISLRRCVAGIAAGTCAVILAWHGFGVTSLVVQLLVSTGLESILLLVASGWRPRLQLQTTALRELLGFSAYRPAARVINYWAQRIDQLLIGKLLGSNALGLYAQAFRMARLPVASVSRGIVDVMFPSLALIQDDPARVRSVYLRATAAVGLLSVPIGLGLFATAQPFVVGVLGPQWQDAVPILRILSLMGLFHSLTVFATSLCLAQGRADLVLRLTIAQRLLMLAGVVFALRWGVLGVAIAQLLAAALNVLPTLYLAGRLIDVTLRAVIARLARVFVAGLVMVGVVLGVNAWNEMRFAALATLAIDVAAGVVTYAAALWLLRVRVYDDFVVALLRPARSLDQSRRELA